MATIVSLDFGVDLSLHRTAGVSEDMVENADVILVMELAHIRQLQLRFPAAVRKTFLLGHFAHERPVTDIKDPYGGTAEEFSQCYSYISVACDGFLNYLKEQAQPRF